jgi:nucleoside-diphosphate-sugar epimerase
MKNILLIGGAGYVGTVLTSHLLRMGYKVTVLDNLIYGQQFAICSYLGESNYKFFLGDICKVSDIESASSGITDVIILSCLVGDPITKKYPVESSIINNQGVRNCIDFFSGRGIDKLIFISTCSNYGLINENEIADEEHELKPLSIYAETKVNSERYLLSKKNTVDYSATILRFATAFGISPRMRFDLTVSEFTRDIFFGNELSVFDEHTWRPYCHVRDFARLCELVLKSERDKIYFEVFNAGGEMNNFTKKMLLDEILKIMPNGQIKYGSQGSDPRNYRVSFSKIRNVLGFIPEYSIRDGIVELVGGLKLGLFEDSMINKEKYGNYRINYHVNEPELVNKLQQS